jgi:hypothetical protein
VGSPGTHRPGTPCPATGAAGRCCTREVVASRLRKAAAAVAEAIEHDTDPVAVQAALHKMFWTYIEDPKGGAPATTADRLRRRQPITTTALGLGGAAALVVPTRTHGGRSPR